MIKTPMLLLFIIGTILQGIDSLSHTQSPSTPDLTSHVHTLLLCRHGDSIWNGGDEGHDEKFTGWTDVPLTELGSQEAMEAAEQLSTYMYDIDLTFTSLLRRAHDTLAACRVTKLRNRQNTIKNSSSSSLTFKKSGSPRVIYDYRLNERHYGALQGYNKADVGAGKYGHSPELVEQWRRSWYACPPLLDDNDPRRRLELLKYSYACGGPENVPKGESLEMVAKNRVRPFLDKVITPLLDQVMEEKLGVYNNNKQDGTMFTADVIRPVTAGLVVAHANSLRALIGVLCEVEDDPVALEILESLRIPTGVPLVVHYQRLANGRYTACPLPNTTECLVQDPKNGLITHPRLAPTDLGHPRLNVWPLDSCIPLESLLYYGRDRTNVSTR